MLDEKKSNVGWLRMTKGLFMMQTSMVSGAETVLINLLEDLRSAETPIDALVAIPGKGPLADQLHALGIRVRFVGFPLVVRTRNPIRVLNFSIQYIRAAVQLLRLLRQEQVCFIHANHLRCLLVLRLVHWAYRVRVIWHVHDIYRPSRQNSLVLRWAARSVSNVVCVSHAVRRNLVHLGVPSKKCLVIYNGVPRTRGSQAARCDLRCELGLAPDAPIIGSIGQLASWKGQNDFVQAAVFVAENAPSAHFVIVGDIIDKAEAGYRAGLLAAIEQTGLADRIHFLGYRPDVTQLLDQLTVLVHTSFREDPLPTIIIEAMAKGRPVVGTRVGGVPELIDHGRTGLLVQPREPQALAHAIQKFLADPELAAMIGDAARKRIIQLQDGNASLRQWQTLYLDGDNDANNRKARKRSSDVG